MSLLSRLHSVLAPLSERTPERLTPDLDIVDDLGIDSLGKLDMVMALERLFGVSISDDDAENIQTVGDAARLLDAKLVTGPALA